MLVFCDLQNISLWLTLENPLNHLHTLIFIPKISLFTIKYSTNHNAPACSVFFTILSDTLIFFCFFFAVFALKLTLLTLSCQFTYKVANKKNIQIEMKLCLLKS